jgi:hypothetical protein
MPLSKVTFEGPEEELTQTKYCQPALFVHGLACLQVLKERVGDFEVQAMAELIERGVDIASIHTPTEGPSRLAICQKNRPVLNQIFRITK